MNGPARTAIAFAAVAFLLPDADAALYRSVDEKGIVMFSDVPPAAGNDARRIRLPGEASMSPDAVRLADAANALTEERIRSGDQAVERASLQVDAAEHALAVARRPAWAPADLMKLESPRMTREDRDRVAYYRRNLKVAQTQLSDLLRTRRRAEAATMTAEAGLPIYGPSSPIYRR